MRFFLASISSAMILAAGCNSKPSQPEPAADPITDAESRESHGAKPVFRNRAAPSTASSNEVGKVRTPTALAKRRSSLPSPTLPINPSPSEVEQLVEEPVAEDALADAISDVRPEDIPEEDDDILI